MQRHLGSVGRVLSADAEEGQEAAPSATGDEGQVESRGTWEVVSRWEEAHTLVAVSGTGAGGGATGRSLSYSTNIFKCPCGWAPRGCRVMTQNTSPEWA